MKLGFMRICETTAVTYSASRYRKQICGTKFNMNVKSAIIRTLSIESHKYVSYRPLLTFLQSAMFFTSAMHRNGQQACKMVCNDYQKIPLRALQCNHTFSSNSEVMERSHLVSLNDSSQIIAVKKQEIARSDKTYVDNTFEFNFHLKRFPDLLLVCVISKTCLIFVYSEQFLG